MKQIIQAIQNAKDNTGKMETALKGIGRVLEDNSELVPLLLNVLGSKDTYNSNTRTLAVKNLAKFTGSDMLKKLISQYPKEEDSKVRRELVSAIGRQRDIQHIPFLGTASQDIDPKVVLQAIRALLKLRAYSPDQVEDYLKKLREHDNETIRFILEVEKNEPQKSRHNHTDVRKILKNVIVHGDVLETLAKIPEEVFHLTFTSPPYYNMRDYSIYQSYKEYLFFLKNVFKEIHRLTKEGRFLIVNTSPVIEPRLERKYSSHRYPIPYDLHSLLVQEGWVFVDDIIWVKPEASASNKRIGGFLQRRRPLSYKPIPISESVMVYRKATPRLIDWNLNQYKTIDEKVFDASLVQGPNDAIDTNNIWKISPRSSKVHPAIFPAELCEKIITYYSMVGDLVFDPFGGSGTLATVANQKSRNFFLTELNDSYFSHLKATFKKELFKEETTFFEQTAFLNNHLSLIQHIDLKQIEMWLLELLEKKLSFMDVLQEIVDHYKHKLYEQLSDVFILLAEKKLISSDIPHHWFETYIGKGKKMKVHNPNKIKSVLAKEKPNKKTQARENRENTHCQMNQETIHQSIQKLIQSTPGFQWQKGNNIVVLQQSDIAYLKSYFMSEHHQYTQLLPMNAFRFVCEMALHIFLSLSITEEQLKNTDITLSPSFCKSSIKDLQKHATFAILTIMPEKKNNLETPVVEKESQAVTLESWIEDVCIFLKDHTSTVDLNLKSSVVQKQISKTILEFTGF